MSTDNQDEIFEQQKEILDDSSLENELLEGDGENGENTQNKENQSEEEETRDNPPNIESDIHNCKLVTCMRDQQYLVKSMKQVMEKHLNMLGEVESITRNLATAERTRLETIREQRLATEEVRKVLVEAQKISSTIQQTPADSERQFRRLDGNVFNSTTIDATLEASHIQQPNASIGQNVSLEIAQALNNTALEIRKTLESKGSDNKKDYKLTRKSNMDVWMDHLRSELTEKDLIDVINDQINPPNNLTADTISKRRNKVRRIIISHLEEYYHAEVLNISDPKLVLQRIREFRRTENNLTHSAVRTQLYNLKLNKNESAHNFITRFNELIRSYENCEEAIPLTNEEKRSAFYQAVSDTEPDIRSADLMKRQMGEQMTLDQLKSYLLQLEAERKAAKPQKATTTTANSAQVKPAWQSGPHRNCHRCNKTGHNESDCPLIKYDLYFCYVCRQVSSHIGTNCPKRGNENYRGGNSSRGRGYVNKLDNKQKWSSTSKTDNQTRGRGRIVYKGGQTSFNRNNKKPYSRPQKSNAKANLTGEILNDNTSTKEIKFVADSGATEHIVKKSIILSNFKYCSNEVIKSANKNRIADIKIDGKGDLYLYKVNTNQSIKLTNVLAAENIAKNLISLRRFVDAGLGIYLDDKTLTIFDKITGDEFLSGKYEKPNWIVTLKVNTNDSENCEVKSYQCNGQIISDFDHLDQSQTNDVLGLSVSEGETTQNIRCDSSGIGREKCRDEQNLNENENNTGIEKLESDFKLDEQTLNRKILDLNSVKELEKFNKMKELESNKTVIKNNKLDEAMLWHSKMEKLPFKETRTRSVRPLHTIHVDTMGPITPLSFPGENRFIIVFIDDFSRYAQVYPVQNKSEAGKDSKVCYIRTDNGTEFCGGEFLEIMKEEKIEENFAPPYTPEHNGTAEKFNKTLQQKIRALLIGSGVPKRFWSLAAETAVNVYNRTPHKSNNFETPLYRINSSLKNHLDSLRRFGCLAYVRIPITETKFSERALKTILVGYSSTGYVLWHYSTNRFINSRHVKFNEKQVYKDLLDVDRLEEHGKLDENNIDWFNVEENNSIPIINNELVLEEQIDKKNLKRGRPKKKSLEEQEIKEKEVKIPKLSKRIPKPKLDENFVYRAKTQLIEDTSFAFFTAKDIEIDKFQFGQNLDGQENKAIEIDELKHAMFANINKDPTNCDEARKRADWPKWKKAMEEEIKSMDDNQMDVKTAFLYGKLDELIYMEIPEGIENGDKIKRTKWNNRFSEVARKLGLENDVNEPCLYTWRKEGKMAVLALYVDDMIAASNYPEKLEEIKTVLKSEFEMKMLGEPKMFLGMKIERDRSNQEMLISQPDYIEKILERFNMKECKPQNTPMVTRQVKHRSEKGKIKQNENQVSSKVDAKLKVPYREAIGSLLYLAGTTRPDISYAVNYLSRRQLNTTEEDWVEVKRIFRYLRGTSNVGLRFRGLTNNLEAVTDEVLETVKNQPQPVEKPAKPEEKK
ncbi:uncharacterized protein LOC123302841 [Chrysoperla carnea]|uniref:uncharacterized protein LOC123302841 n=1 Tax=Chrysoperla carnea TaxID=189513 RepID=UPI001D08054A|nr:uncharacterized protein LOC123302841 [Chrysoperla carnea]